LQVVILNLVEGLGFFGFVQANFLVRLKPGRLLQQSYSSEEISSATGF